MVPAGRCSLAAAAALLALLCAAAPAAATKYEPWLWNRHFNYTATKVPADVFIRGLPVEDGGKEALFMQSSLFPLAGYNVKQQCRGPGQTFEPPSAHDAAGACGWSVDNGVYSYWEKEPGPYMRNSNCYCYAVDKYLGSWCAPGVGGGAGALTQESMSCDSLARGIIADGAKPVSRAEVASGAPAPGGEHYIALRFRPQASCFFPRCGPDFHFLRRDDNGVWSHKPGEAPVTNVDADGKPIRDPETANIAGGYTEFCGYFKVNPSTMKVGVQPGVPDRVGKGIDAWRTAGVAFSEQPLQYDESVDARSPEQLMRERMQMQRSQQQQQQQQGGAQMGRRLLAGARRALSA